MSSGYRLTKLTPAAAAVKKLTWSAIAVIELINSDR